MGVIRVYIKPFAGFDSQLVEYVPGFPEPPYFKEIKKGVYSDEWYDVSNDILDNQLSNISQSLDYGDYDVGIFKFNEMELRLNNKLNKYGTADSFGSIFKYKRTNSLIKITYDIQPLKPMCGAVPCGAIKTFQDEIELFEGVLNDDTFEEDIDTITSRFKILGFESLFKKGSAYTTDAGPNLRVELVLKYNKSILDGPLPILSDPTLDLLTFDDLNFNPAYPEMDPFDGWLWSPSAFKDSSENLNAALQANNSVLLIESRQYIVKDRTPPTVDPVYTFNGQNADGPENIISLGEVKNGLNRSFNQWSFKDQQVSIDESFSQTYGLRPKVLDFDMSGVDSEDVIDYLNYMRDEWKEPKIELKLTTPMNNDTTQIKLLDRVNIDLPPVIYPTENAGVYGSGVYGESVYPQESYSFTLEKTTHFKVMGIDYNLSQQNITFLLREI